MLKPFTDGGRITMALANREAQRLGHDFIGSGHVLLGLAAEATGAAILADLGVDRDALTREVERRLLAGASADAPAGSPPMMTVKQIVLAAMESATGDPRVGSGHLLLGVLAVPGTAAQTILAGAGVTPERARDAAQRIDREAYAPAEGTHPAQHDRSKAGRVTDRALRALAVANLLAQRLNHQHVSAEHVLLSLLEMGGVSSAVLENLGVDSHALRLDLRRRLTPAPHRAHRVLEHATEEAAGLGHYGIGTEHLLLGVLRDTAGPAAEALGAFGVTLEAVRNAVRTIYSDPGDGEQDGGHGHQ